MECMNSHPASPVVLVVEDDWLLRHEIVSELQEAGWIVLEAGTGQGAIALLEQGQHVDLLITDIHLADALTGWDVAEAVRAAAVDVPVVYASGNPSIGARRVPGSVFLCKPFAISELVDISRSIVGGKAPEHITATRI
jgi:CheY-like chemotaxis protein